MSAQSATDAAPAAQTVQDDKFGRKVFIGNLAYTATEDEVRAFVGDASGKLESLELATRSNGRAAGYAFAVWSSASEAEEAVQQLDKKSLQDREIHVAIAKARSDKPRGDSRRKADGPKEVVKDEEGVVIDAPANGEQTDGSKKKRNQRKKRATRRLPTDEDEDSEQVKVEAQAEGEGSNKPKAKRNRKPKSRAPKVDGEAAPDGAAESARIDDEGSPKEQTQQAANSSKPQSRQPRVATTGQPSSTLVFVANLPFSVNDDQLADIFKGLSIGIKSAKVITKPGYRKKGGDDTVAAPTPRSKGFGFVETTDSAQQKIALEKLEGYKIDDREIVVKVANERQAVEENSETKQE